jgi:hypothetical protein
MSSGAKLFTDEGLELQSGDCDFLINDSYLYFDAHGGPFNGKRLIDQYEKIEKLG